MEQEQLEKLIDADLLERRRDQLHDAYLVTALITITRVRQAKRSAEEAMANNPAHQQVEQWMRTRLSRQ